MRTPHADGSGAADGPSRLLRAYAVTGGRTRPSHDHLEMESLVSTTILGDGAGPRLGLEQRAIVRLCGDVISIAEVSSHLDLPLGVTRVLVGDMAEAGLVTIHRPAAPAAQPDLVLLQRVLAGLRSI